jgi:hypothetical protein
MSYEASNVTHPWLALNDEDFPWDLVLIHSNGDHNTFILTQVVTKALIILSKAHSWDPNNVLEKGMCSYPGRVSLTRLITVPIMCIYTV